MKRIHRPVRASRPVDVPPPAVAQGSPHADALAERYRQVRARTMALAAPLSEADCQVQSMPDASPTKWHLAHVTWFFETFVLADHEPGFAPFQDTYWFLFNSYYETLGPRYSRPDRGLISRPGAHEVGTYRANVDARMLYVTFHPPARDEYESAIRAERERLIAGQPQTGDSI